MFNDHCCALQIGPLQASAQSRGSEWQTRPERSPAGAQGLSIVAKGAHSLHPAQLYEGQRRQETILCNYCIALGGVVTGIG